MYATTFGRWAYRAVVLLAAISVVVVLGPAVFGVQHWNVGGLGGFIGAAVGARLRNPDFWRLDRTGRRRVEHAVLSGVPTGSATLDPIGRDRLTQAARADSRGNTIAQVVLAVLVLAGPVAAGARLNDERYLLAELPIVLLIACVAWTRVTRESPARRLARFDDMTTSGPAVPDAPTPR